MGNPQSFSCLSLELKIIQAKNVETKTRGDLFVRCYLPGGSNKKRIGLNTKEIRTKNDHVWNESFSLECSGIGGSMDITKPRQESLVFELRWRKRVPVIGTSAFVGSKLLGRAEIAWKEVIESPNMVLDKWVTMVNSSGGDRVFKGGLKPAKLKVEIRVRVWTEEEILGKTTVKMGKKNLDECGCKDGHHHGQYACDEYYDVFALAATLEAF